MIMNDNEFKGKYALLDVNILSEIAKEKRAEKFRSVLEFLKNNGIDIFVLDATRFEFVGFAGNKIDYDFSDDWIKRFPIAPTTKDDVGLAILISSIYKCRHSDISPKQISYCDCLYASQIIKYKGRAFLITTDVHDYPISIFDISKIDIIDNNGRAIFAAFITFNKEKWENAKERFEKSGNDKKRP